jgi:hypothetical protein
LGILRVSRTNGREGESFHSPEERAERICAACEAHKLCLIGEPPEELDTSAASAA